MKNKLKNFIDKFREKEIRIETIYADDRPYKVKQICYKSLFKSLINKLIKHINKKGE